MNRPATQVHRDHLFHLSEPLDELLADISTMTYTQFLDTLRGVLTRLEHDLLAMAH